MNIHFLYLRSFSKTGGIEKFNKLFMLALSLLASKAGLEIKFISAYDTKADATYINKSKFKGFDKGRIRFTLYTFFKSLSSDIIILGHINLSIVGFLIKIVRPQKKVFLIVHGIEVWQKQRYFKKWMLLRADKIISVSDFTKKTIVRNYPEVANNFTIFPNTFDPLFNWPKTFEKPEYLISKYSIKPTDKILLTVSRLEYSEKYKGYDKVFEAIPYLVEEFPTLRYFIVGKSDKTEFARIQELIVKFKIEKYVNLIGYIPDDELIDHYKMANIFVMPSKKEGFGIVFIEAALCGIQVIGGNKDGSKEALLHGKIGQVINPDDATEIGAAIKHAFKNPLTVEQKLNQQKLVEENFGFEVYKNRLENILLH